VTGIESVRHYLSVGEETRVTTRDVKRIQQEKHPRSRMFKKMLQRGEKGLKSECQVHEGLTVSSAKRNRKKEKLKNGKSGERMGQGNSGVKKKGKCTIQKRDKKKHKKGREKKRDNNTNL